MNKVLLETSWDDAPAEDMRIADMLRQYGLPGTFYIPIGYFERRTLTDQDVEKLSKDFEIGSHTVNHYSLRHLSEADLKYELEESKFALERNLNKEITSLCYPRGRYNDAVKAAAKKAGYTEGRTTKVLDTSLEYDPFEKGTTIHMYPRKEYNGKPVVEIAKEFIEKVSSEGGRFHLWGH